jgi:hypothetical protein
VVQAILPPTEFYVEHFYPGTKPHIRQPQERQRHVIAKRMILDAFCCQRGEAGVDLRGDHIGNVVLRDQAECLLGIFIQGSCGQGVYIDVIPGYVPIDFVGRGKVGYPGFRPALESRGNRFSWIGSGSWGERLKNVEGAPVTESPGGKGKDRDQPA